MKKLLPMRIGAVLFLIIGVVIGYFVAVSESGEKDRWKFHLGLDLSGGSHLVYQADTSAIAEGAEGEAMASLRDVIERRVNLFGVAEPNVQTEIARSGGEKQRRLIVELPGITDVEEAIDMIGQTPLLQFKTERPIEERTPILEAQEAFRAQLEAGETPEENDLVLQDPFYVDTELTGRYLNNARLEFTGAHGGQGFGGEPTVALEFNKEGADLFATITRENLNKTVAIYLDGAPVTTPVVNTEITNGEAIITGNFTPDEAKTLVGRLNSGALPVPIELVGTESIGPTLGSDAVQAGMFAGFLGLVLVAVFMILYYRVPGLLAAIALAIYAAVMLGIFKLLPVTLTSAGIAGFIMSLGIAVDANVLIFERMKEEMREGNSVYESIQVGFSRAWTSIRDANITTFFAAVFLFVLGTSLVQGFALTFGLGVLISVLSAITVTKTFLLAASGKGSKVERFLFNSGLHTK